ncbi:MAG: Gfo/Idh/MocA family protein [Clostridia bacterium]
MNMVKIGIVGIGNTRSIADDHIQAFQKCDNAKVIAIYTRTKQSAVSYLERTGLDSAVCDSYEELLSMVDAVIICTSNKSHVELTKKAVEAGVHVLCEKPYGQNSSEGREVSELAAEKGLINIVGYNFRYLPGIMYIKQLIEEGQLGEIYTYHHHMGANRLADPKVPYEWRMDENECRGGAIVDFGSHMIDLLYNLVLPTTGQITQIMGLKSTYIHSRINSTSAIPCKVTSADSANIIMKTEKDALLTLTCSRAGSFPDFVEIAGSKGMVKYSLDDMQSVYFWRQDISGGYKGLPSKVELEETGLSTYAVQAQMFVNGIIHNKSLQQDLTHAIKVMETMDRVLDACE